MAAAVNSVNSFEFVKIDGIPAQDDAAPANDPIQVNKHQNQILKKELSLDWEPNDNDINGVVANVTTGTVDTVPLEDIPIIILQQPTQPRIVKKKILYECRICHKTFPEFKTLQEHSAKCKIIGCPLCKFRTFEESDFKEHWKMHEDLQRKLKPIFTFTDTKEVPPPNLDCPNCKKKYKTKNHLYLHMFKCERLRCMHCDFETFKTHELKRHFNTVHLAPEEVTKTCPRCNKVLKNRHSLSTHKWICGKKPRCECHDCGYKTFNKYNLRTHILAKHMQPKIEKNLSNDIIVPEKVIVPQIVDTGHPFTEKVCNLCNKVFKHQRALSAHNIHCKLYKCNHCPFESFRKAHLKKHMQKNHKLKNASLKSQLDLPNSSCQLEVPRPSGRNDLPSSSYQLEIPSPSSKLEIPNPSGQHDLPSSSYQLEIPSPSYCKLEIPNPSGQCDTPSSSGQLDIPKPSGQVDIASPSYQLDFPSPLCQLDIPSPSCQLDISNSSCTEQMCQICYEIFQNEAALRAHAVNCKEYECSQCKYKTYIQADLTNHIQQKHQRNGRIQQKRQRNGRIQQKQRRNGRIQQKRQQNGRTGKSDIACPKCGKAWYSKQAMAVHAIHCGKDFVQCEYCPYKSKRASVLKKHVESVHPSTLELEDDIVDQQNDEPTAVCEKCGQNLKEYETMTFHNFYCPKKPFLDCNMCSFKTRYGLCLKNHVLRVHCQSILESYECPKCSGKLKTQETFKRHLFSCIPETVLRCSLCTYMTRDPSCLSDHVIDKHYKADPLDTSDTKLIPCPKCGNKVKNPQSLQSHLKICEKEPQR